MWHTPILNAPLDLPDEAATLALGAHLSRSLAAPLLVYLQGDLGAGKTTLMRGLLRGLGYAGRVKSPTYTLLESYDLPGFTLNHFDLYRLCDPREWLEAGFDELCGRDSVCVIEWPQRAAGALPPADAWLELKVQGTGRQCSVRAESERGKRWLQPG
jgi:tRNA threonylcarbamoyladenosine biosynthesis protein TsaE